MRSCSCPTSPSRSACLPVTRLATPATALVPRVVNLSSESGIAPPHCSRYGAPTPGSHAPMPPAEALPSKPIVADTSAPRDETPSEPDSKASRVSVPDR
eukprot:scaffold2634_cov90-Isochrysis_galbana.AAC.2